MNGRRHIGKNTGHTDFVHLVVGTIDHVAIAVAMFNAACDIDNGIPSFHSNPCLYLRHTRLCQRKTMAHGCTSIHGVRVLITSRSRRRPRNRNLRGQHRNDSSRSDHSSEILTRESTGTQNVPCDGTVPDAGQMRYPTTCIDTVRGSPRYALSRSRPARCATLRCRLRSLSHYASTTTRTHIMEPACRDPKRQTNRRGHTRECSPARERMQSHPEISRYDEDCHTRHRTTTPIEVPTVREVPHDDSEYSRVVQRTVR